MDNMDIEVLRHSCSHIMAYAVQELWPGTKLGIGPAIEDGFYYDFDRKEPFAEEDLARIEDKMREIIFRDEPFIAVKMDKDEARRLFSGLREDYKLELLKEIPGDEVTVYRTGEKFVDLCRGPHVPSSGSIKAFKLVSLAGAYWHGIETNPMLQRIYGVCFEQESQLQEHLRNIEEAKKRDHRKLGPQLGLFDIYHEEAGAGLVFYHPKGAVLRSIIEDYEKKEHLRRGYQMVITPHIMQAGLWKTSGHYDYYKENMYSFPIEGKEYVLKPMNCPGHILIYKSRIRSYRELPLRLFELGTVYRHEKAGVMHGLLRVRGFTQDDAHIFCLPEQLKSEIQGIIDFVFDTMKVFGFDSLGIELSTRPEKYIGSEKDWETATSALEGSLKERGVAYDINHGDGAFYGPKIDIKLKDALKRTWQCATIQCDFTLPQRFGLVYADADGSQKQPVMLHRVVLGSLERFTGALIEHYGGSLPLWLSPVQVILVPLKEEQDVYAAETAKILETAGIRVKVDGRNETLNKRIREAELEKVPYVAVIGGREAENNTVSLRKRGAGDLGALSRDKFLELLEQEARERK
ncbi:MAG: threonine--tRNA ligase [Candidatus Omnitrophota bacterium]